jgi:hypothetical protein
VGAVADCGGARLALQDVTHRPAQAATFPIRHDVFSQRLD